VRTAFTDLVGEHPLVGFNRSPAVVAEASKTGALGVLAATAYRPEELDAELTCIDGAAEAGDERAIEPQSYYIGQAVGSLARVRPGAEITSDLVEACRARLVELGQVADSV
jgi:hypothetical protein